MSSAAAANTLPEHALLEYSIHACSSYSGQYAPENILLDNPQDQRSRWSGGNGFTSVSGTSLSSAAQATSSSTPGSGASAGTTRERQWLLLKLASPAVLRQVTFGKYCRSHPCNVRDFKIWAGQTANMQAMSLVSWSGLKNDSTAETFDVTYQNRDGVVLPCEYICIEPLSAHSSNYNISIWHIALHGNDDEETVARVQHDFDQFRETHTSRLILKHLRQRGLLKAFEALQQSLPSTSATTLEHPLVTRLHEYLVKNGNFDAVEALLSEIAYPESSQDEERAASSLLDEYCSRSAPGVEWQRLDTLTGTSSWNGEAPSPRGGHQLVLVRPSPAEPLSREDAMSEDPDADVEDAEAAIYLFGGWDGATELGDLWRFSLSEQRWEFLHCEESLAAERAAGEGTTGSLAGSAPAPSARSCHQVAVDQQSGDIYLLGRFVDGGSTGATDTGSLVPPRDDASRTTPAVSPGEASWRAAIIAEGGDESSFPLRVQPAPATNRTTDATSPAEREGADFWTYHTRGPARGSWERLSADTSKEGGPPLLFDHQMQIDAESRTLYVFGGKHNSADGTTTYPGLYSYDLTARVWRQVLPGSEVREPERKTIPSRTGHSMLFDPRERKLLILAGQRGETYLSDMWSYSIETGDVECIDADYSTKGGPEGGFTQRATLDCEKREFVLLSGLVRDRSPPHHTNVKNALWTYSLDTKEWRKIETNIASDSMDVDNEGPKARFAHQFVYDPLRGEHYLFGGNPADETISTRLSDFWRLKLHRTDVQQILQRCKFLVRRCRFFEMCESSDSDSMSALLYLQSSLASVAGPADQAEFLSCMSHLLASGNKGESQTWQRRTAVFEDILQYFPAAHKEPLGELVESSVMWQGHGVSL